MGILSGSGSSKKGKSSHSLFGASTSKRKSGGGLFSAISSKRKTASSSSSRRPVTGRNNVRSKSSDKSREEKLKRLEEGVNMIGGKIKAKIGNKTAKIKEKVNSRRMKNESIEMENKKVIDMRVQRKKDEEMSVIQTKVDKEILEKKHTKDKDDIVRDPMPVKHNEKEHMPISEEPLNKKTFRM
jgi:peroxiredoxin family protein